MSSPTASALLVVDLQQFLVNPPPEDGPRSTPSLEANVSSTLTRWRGLQYPLRHIYHRASYHFDPLHASHLGKNAAHSCAAPLPGETVGLEATESAFASDHEGTSLHETLEKLQSPAGEKRKVVVIGKDGAQGVNSTTRSAADLGFDIAIVADACASFGMPRWKKEGGEGGNWGPEETHNVAMSMLACGYAQVVTTEELLRELK